MITRKPDNSGYGAYLQLKTQTDGSLLFDFPKCTTKATTTSSAASNKVAVVVQNYVNGTSWYRVWSDGWIEQGGVITTTTTAYPKGKEITLIKPMTTTTYTLLATAKSNDNSGSYTYQDFGIASQGTNSFVFRLEMSNYFTAVNWYVCGY